MRGLEGLLAKLMPEGREDVPWATMAAILSIARFCEPSSELHIEEKWYRRTALEELIDVAPEIAKPGYSRDSRGDRPQVCIGLVITEEGFPRLRHHDQEAAEARGQAADRDPLGP